MTSSNQEKSISIHYSKDNEGKNITINTYNNDYVQQVEFGDEKTRGFYLQGLILKLMKHKIKVHPSLLTDLKNIKEKYNKNKDFIFGLEAMDEKHYLHKVFMIDMKKHNQLLLACIDNKYKEYKTLNKYINPEFEEQEITIITPEGEIGKDSLKLFKLFLSQKKKAPCFSWATHLQTYMWLDTPDLQTEFKRFKKLIKDKELLIKEEWKTSGIISNTEWFGIVVKPKGSEVICVGSLKLFNKPIQGWVYWFNSESNRDAMFLYLLK